MRGPLTDSVRIFHILDAISEVESYLKGVSIHDFLGNSEKRFATIKQIEIVGEACNRITQDLKDKHREIKWQEINGFRNISIHE
jgi:uncharacterized protein with HEPN domain